MNYEDFKKQKRGKVRFESNGYNQFDEHAKVMDEADKRKEVLQIWPRIAYRRKW